MENIVELTRKYLNQTPEDLEVDLLNEVISLRTGFMATGLVKTKQYANKLDTEVQNLKKHASNLGTSKSHEDAQKKLAEALNTIGSLFYLNRKMLMYVAMTAASTGMNNSQQNKILKRLDRLKN